ncbi:MAG: GLPGLI family protein [Gemmatimonadota bacterium]
MKFRPLLLSTLLAGLPALASAQSGTVRYDETIPLDFKLPPNSPMAGRLPKSSTKPMQLTFSPEAALFALAPRIDGPPGAAGETRVMTAGPGNAVFMGGGGPPGQAMEIRRDGEMAMGAPGMFTFGGPGGPGAGTVAGAYTNLADGSYIEVREFLGRSFRIPEARPTFNWKLTGEQATFLGHPVLQAKAKVDSTTLEAWFAPDIPVSAGPAQYGGLPGLILTLTVDSNKVVYTATAIDIKTAIAPIKAPSEGSKVTRAEFDKIVKEKMDEMSKGRRGRGN